VLADWEKGGEVLTFVRSEAGSAPRGKGKAGAKRKGTGPEVVDAEVVD
jgi:hypothetical protein